MPREAEWDRPLQAWQRKLFQTGAYLAVVSIIFGTGGVLVVTGGLRISSVACHCRLTNLTTRWQVLLYRNIIFYDEV